MLKNNKFLKALMILGLFVMQFQGINATEQNTVEAATLIVNPGNMSENTDGYGYVKVATTTNPHTNEKVYQLWHTNKANYGITYYVDQNSGILYSTGNFNNTYTLGRSNASDINNAYVFQPVEFNGIFEGDVIEVQVNNNVGLVLSSNGELWYTGNASEYDDVGDSLPTIRPYEKVAPSTFDGKVVEMKSFARATLVLTDKGTLYFTGTLGGELFGSAYGAKREFTVAPNPNGETVKKIWSDENSYVHDYEAQFIVQTTNGNYYGVGYGGATRAAGLNRTNSSYGWQPVMEKRNGTIQPLEANSVIDFKTYNAFLTYALRSDGTIWTTGWEGFYTRGYEDGNTVTQVFEEYTDWGNDNVGLFDGDVTAIVMKELNGENDLWVVGENYRDLGTVTPVDTYTLPDCPIGGPAVCTIKEPTPLSRPENYFNSTNWNKTDIFKPQYIIGGYDESLAVDQDGFLRSAGFEASANAMAYNTQAIFPPVLPESTIRTTENYPNYSDTQLGTLYDIRQEDVRNNARIIGEYKLYDTIYLAHPTAEFDGFGQAFEESQMNTLDPDLVVMGPLRGTEYAFDAAGTKQFDVYLDYELYHYNSSTQETLDLVPGYSGSQLVNTDYAELDLSALTTGDYVVKMKRRTVNAEGETYTSLSIQEPFRIVNAPVLTVPEFTEITQGDAFSVMTGVSVTDIEDNDATLLANVIATPATIDTNEVGVYTVDYSVTDSDGNTVTAQQVVVVNDGTITVGENYILRAIDYSIHRKNVVVDNVLVDGSVELFSKAGESLPVTTETVSVTYGTPSYTNAPTQAEASLDYPITFGVIAEPTVESNIIATVSNEAPEILGADYVEINQNDAFDPMAGVTAIDTEDGDLTADIIVTGTVDTATPGVYVISYSVTDSEDNTSTVKRVVVVKGEGIVVGNDYIIMATDFTQGVGEVDVPNVANFAAVKLYDKQGNELPVSGNVNITYGNPSYENAASTAVDTTGVYPITFTHVTDSAATITIDGNVTNYAPVISGESYIEVNQGDIVNTIEGLTVTDVEDEDNTVTLFGGSLSTDVPGVYKVDVTATDSDGNTTTFTRVYVVKGEGIVIGDTHIIMATDFVTQVSQADVATVLTDANVKVFDKAGNQEDAASSVTITYSTPDYRNASSQTEFVKVYPINFTVTVDPAATIDIDAKVIHDDAVVGENYALIASDFTIDLADAPAYMDADTTDVLTSANAKATHIYDGTDGTPEVLSNGIQPQVGSYKVMINVAEEPTLQKEITVIVKDSNTVIGENYGLKAENFKITVDQAAAYMDADIADVIGDNGAKVVAWELKTNNPADVALSSNGIQATEGVYPVEIYVVNEPTTKKTVYVTVTGDNGSLTGDEEILLVAHDFTVDLTQGETLPTTIEEFISLANVEAFYTADGTEMTDLSALSVVPTTMAGYEDGLYAVTFTLTDASGDAVVTVNALVIDENTGTGIIDGVNYAVTAEDFLIDKRTGSGYAETDYDTSAKIVAAANAIAINADTHEVDATKLVVSSPATFVGTVAGIYETSYTIDGTTITGVANVLVIDDNSTVGADGVVINGYNFTITSGEAMSLTAADLIATGNVTAFNIDTLEVYDVVVNATNLVAINTGVSGVYPVELSVEGSDTTKTIYVTVLDDDGVLTGDGEYLLNAYDFTVDLTKGETLPTTIEEFVTLANAKITNTQTGEVVTDYSNLTTSPASMANYTDGLYAVTFTLADESGDAVLTVNALVIDENTGTGIIDGVNYAVTADDLVIDKRTGSGYADTDYDTSAKIVAAANAKAINADTREEDTSKLVVSNPATFVGTVAGVYETTYTIDGTTITGRANVLVIDDNSTVGADGVVINGSNFTITSDVAVSLTDADVITTGNVSAFNMDTTEVYDVVVSATDLAAINTGVSGVYPVELSVEGSDTTKTIFVTVTDDNGVVTGDGEYLLNAYDFTVDLTQGEVLPTTIEEFVTLANAKITNTQTGEVVTDYSNLTTSPASMANYTDGLYDVTFTLADESGDAVLTVKALVIDENTGTGIIDGVNYAVTADDFVIDKRTGSGYVSTDYDTSAKIVEAANAKAINADTYEVDASKLVVSNPASFVDSVAGVYETTYTIDGTTITGIANVLVIDDNSTVGADGVVINGSNFTITSVVAMSLTDADVIATGNVSAFNMDTTEVYDVVVSATDLTAINTGIGGVYPVELSVEGSDTTKTIYVTVLDDNGVVTGDGEYLLQAYDFTVDLTQGEVLPTTIEEFVTLANAKITNTQTGEVVTDYSNLTTSPASMANYTDGLYDVTFTLADESGDAVLTVKALVIDENTGTGIIDGVNYAVTADDLVIDKRTGSGYTDTDYDTSAKIVAGANAVAINADTYEVDASKLVVSNPASFVDSVAGVYETTYTIDGTTITGIANVLVIDDNSTVGADGVVINGSNFTITSDVAVSLTDADVITTGNVSAFNMDTTEVYDVVVSATDLANINTGVSGVYPVELSVEGSDTTKTIFVTVTDDNGVVTGDGEYLLNAYDFTVDLTQGEILPTTIEEFVTLANAKITNTQTGEVVTDYSNLTVVPATMANYTDGLYDVTFTLVDESGDAVLTVKALVIDENTGTGIIDGVNYAVTADDFVIDKRTGSGYVSTDYDTSAKIVEAANAKAINADTYEVDASKLVVSNPASFVDSEAGVYETTYTIDGTTITGIANVLVIDDNSTVGVDGVVINGSNFTITSDVAVSLTDADVITTGNVSAFNMDTTEVYDVVINATDLAAINTGVSGVYPVELSVEGSDTTKTIFVTVTDDNGVVTGDGEYLLNAYDFTVDLTQGEVLPTTIEEFVTLANAKITNTQTGEVVTDYSNLTTSPASMANYTDGLYDVTFTLADESGDAVLTVKALVIDENTGTGIIDGVNYAVTADDFIIDKRTGSGYVSTDYDTSAKIVEAANAKAINADTYEVDASKLVVSNPASFVDSIAGVYETTYTIDGTTITGIANVLVIDDNSTIGADGVVINGSNFAVTSDVAMSLTDADVITNGIVSAFNIDTLEVYDVLVDATDLAAINTGISGVYPVELSVEGSDTTKTIYVTVTDEDGVLTGDGEYLLNAYDFTVDLTQGETLPTTIEEFVTLANAKITNTQTGEVVTDYSNLTTSPASMANYTDGLYDVTFTLADESGDAVLTVKALVIDENTGTGIIDGVNYAVTANDIVIDKRSGSSYVATDFDSSEKIVAVANAVAINSDTFEEDLTKLVVSSPASFADSIAGVYQTTYTIDGSAVSGTANVLVIDDSSTVGLDDVVINGNNFMVTSDVAMTLNSQDVITTGMVSAFNQMSGEVYDVVVSATDLANINSGASGVYPVELSVVGSTTTKLIYVTVTDDNGVLTGDGNYLLQANDFTVDITQGGVLPTTINEFVTLANVKITDTQTGEVITDYSNLMIEPSTMVNYPGGLYDVTFTFDDAVLMVKSLVIDDYTGTGVIDGVNYVVSAKEFVIDKRFGSGYLVTDYDSSMKIVAAANAVVINADTYEEDATKLVVSSPASFVDSSAGIYETSYTIEGSTVSGVANVFVIDDSSTVGLDGVVINGSNFTVTSDVAMTLTSQDVITNGMVTSFNQISGEIYDVVVSTIDLAAVNTGISGVYPIWLSVVGSDTTKTIFVTVTDENGVLTGDGEFLLVASDFTVDLVQGGVLPTTTSEFITLANVKITNTQTGEMISDYSSLTVMPSTMEGYLDGLYDVAFTYDDAVLTVKALVVDEDTGTGVIDGVNYAVIANDFIIDKRSGSGYLATDYDSSEMIVAAANATAINAVTYEEDLTKLVVSSLASFVDSVAGVYETTYTIDGSAVSGVANVLVIDDDSTVGADGVVINGSNFVVTSDLAVDLTAADVIANGMVSAFDQVSGEVYDVGVADLSVINTGLVGVYPVELNVVGSTTTKVIYVTVVDENTAIANDSMYIMAAYDFVVDLSQGDVLPTTIEEFVTYSNIKIYNSVGEEIVDYSKLVALPNSLEGAVVGVIPIKYTYTDGDSITEITVSANIIDTPLEYTESTYYLDGSEAVIHFDDLSSVNLVDEFGLEVVLDTAGDTDKTYDLSEATFSVNLEELTVGLYFVDIVVDDLELTLPLVVVDDNSVIENGIVLLVDSTYISLTQDEALGITFEDLVQMSNARAYEIATGEELALETLTPEKVSQISNGVVGTYEVSVKANPESFVIVEVTGESVTSPGGSLIPTGAISYSFIVVLLLGLLIISRAIKYWYDEKSSK